MNDQENSEEENIEIETNAQKYYVWEALAETQMIKKTLNNKILNKKTVNQKTLNKKTVEKKTIHKETVHKKNG